MPDVRDFEPHLALVGSGRHRGGRPRGAPRRSRPGGWLVLEVGDGQAPATAALCSPGSATPTSSTTPDLTGRDRVVEGRRVDG